MPSLAEKKCSGNWSKTFLRYGNNVKNPCKYAESWNEMLVIIKANVMKLKFEQRSDSQKSCEYLSCTMNIVAVWYICINASNTNKFIRQVVNPAKQWLSKKIARGLTFIS